MKLDVGGDAGDRETRLADYLAGRLAAADRAALEAELLGDAQASEALYAQVNLQGAIADEGRRRRGLHWRRRSLIAALPLAAAIALLWLGPGWRERAGSPAVPRLRGEAGQVKGLEPAGSLDAPARRFRWTADARARLYRFELYDAEARLRFSALAADTLLLWPASMDSLPPARGFWRVVPVDAAGRELDASAPLHFAAPAAGRQ